MGEECRVESDNRNVSTMMKELPFRIKRGVWHVYTACKHKVQGVRVGSFAIYTQYSVRVCVLPFRCCEDFKSLT